MDKEVAEEMDIINNARLNKSIQGSHVYKPMIDPRLKYDSEFINFQKLLHRKFEKDAEDFIERMDRLREETEKQFELRKKKNEKRRGKLEQEDKKSKRELYEKIKNTQQEFIKFLRKRQEYLEKKKKGILSQKSWKNPNPNYQKYLKFIEDKREEIHKFRQAFDWQLIKEHELKTIQDLQHRKEKREKQDVVNSKKLNFYTNKKAYNRVVSVDKFNKRKYVEPKNMMDKRRQYSEIVRKRFKPRVSEENQNLSEKVQNELNENIQKLKERRQKGLLNVSKSKTYLSYSRLIGQKAKDRLSKSTKFTRKSDKDQKNLSKNIQAQTDNILTKSSYLDQVRSLNQTFREQMKKKKEEKQDASRRVISFKKKKIYGSNYNSYHKNQLEAEVNYLDHKVKIEQSRLKNTHKYGLDKVKAEQEADNLLIESMMAKCLYNESQINSKMKRFFKKTDEKYEKPKTPINYKKARFKVNLKQRDELIKKYKEKKGQSGGSGNQLGQQQQPQQNGGDDF